MTWHLLGDKPSAIPMLIYRLLNSKETNYANLGQNIFFFQDYAFQNVIRISAILG